MIAEIAVNITDEGIKALSCALVLAVVGFAFCRYVIGDKR